MFLGAEDLAQALGDALDRCITAHANCSPGGPQAHFGGRRHPMKTQTPAWSHRIPAWWQLMGAEERLFPDVDAGPLACPRPTSP